jgi:GT2 family glycosyltransferase
MEAGGAGDFQRIQRGSQMKTAKPVSVIIPLHQDEGTIGRCIETLLAQTIQTPPQIIVVDDGSRDNGPVIVGKYPVTLVRQENAGPAAARNNGAQRATGDLLVFLDSDCEVGPGWLDNLVKFFDDSDVVAALCPLAASTDGIVPRIVQSEIEERYEMLREANREIDFIASAACAVRRDAFREVGGFNEYFRANEDVELAYQLKARGGKIAFADNAPARHAHQTSWSDLLRAKFMRGVWRMRLYRLFPEKRSADSWTPQTLKLQILAAIFLAPVLLGALIFPRLLWFLPLLLAVILVSGIHLLRATTTVLIPVAGIMAPFHAAFWVLSRALTLGAAAVYSQLKQWAPARSRHIVERTFRIMVLVLAVSAVGPPTAAGDSRADATLTLGGPAGKNAPALFGFGAGIWRVPKSQRWITPIVEKETRPGIFRAAISWEVLAKSNSPDDIDALLDAYPLNSFLVDQKRRGARIIIGLDAMPHWLAQDQSERRLGDGPAWAKSRPTDLSAWSQVVTAVVRHFDVELGLSAYYEVWNEPDWSYPGLTNYIDLFEATVRGARSANANAKIAGPAISDWASPAEKGTSDYWLRGFLREIAQRRLPLSALTWHVFYRNSLVHYEDVVPVIRQWMGEAGYAKTPLIVDEWNVAAVPPYPEGDLNASNVGAANAAMSLIEMWRSGVAGQSFQMMADPGSEGYSGGAFSVVGLPHPVFKTFALFSALNGSALEVASSAPVVRAVAFRDRQRLRILVAVMVPTDVMMARSAFEKAAIGNPKGARSLEKVDRKKLGAYVLKGGARPGTDANGERLLDDALQEQEQAKSQYVAFQAPFDVTLDLSALDGRFTVESYQKIDASSAASAGGFSKFRNELQSLLAADAANTKSAMSGISVPKDVVDKWQDRLGKVDLQSQIDEAGQYGSVIEKADTGLTARFAKRQKEISRRLLAAYKMEAPPVENASVILRVDPQSVHYLVLKLQ